MYSISSDGKILHASGQMMEVADSVTFATESRHVSASMDKTISVRYVYPAMNNYPRPFASTCNEDLTPVVTYFYGVFKTAWIEAVFSVCSFLKPSFAIKLSNCTRFYLLIKNYFF